MPTVVSARANLGTVDPSDVAAGQAVRRACPIPYRRKQRLREILKPGIPIGQIRFTGARIEIGGFLNETIRQCQRLGRRRLGALNQGVIDTRDALEARKAPDGVRQHMMEFLQEHKMIVADFHQRKMKKRETVPGPGRPEMFFDPDLGGMLRLLVLGQILLFEHIIVEGHELLAQGAVKIAQRHPDRVRLANNPPNRRRKSLCIDMPTDARDICGVGDGRVGKGYRVQRNGGLGYGERKMLGARRKRTAGCVRIPRRRSRSVRRRVFQSRLSNRVA